MREILDYVSRGKSSKRNSVTMLSQVSEEASGVFDWLFAAVTILSRGGLWLKD
jgi:hypothetical protein